jgi:hypothetical protein
VVPGRRAVHESFVPAGSRRRGCRFWRPWVVFKLLATDAVLNVQARRDERHCASGTLDRTQTRCKPPALSAPQFASTRPVRHRFSSSTPGATPTGNRQRRRHPLAALPGLSRAPRHAASLPPCIAPILGASVSVRPARRQESLCASPAVGCTLGLGGVLAWAAFRSITIAGRAHVRRRLHTMEVSIRFLLIPQLHAAPTLSIFLLARGRCSLLLRSFPALLARVAAHAMA